MKKTMFITAALVASLAINAAFAADPDVRPLAFQEMAYRGATHAITLEPVNFSEDTAGVSQTNTFTVSGPCVWEYVGMEVAAPFDASTLTNTLTLGLTFLAGSDTLANGVESARDTARPYKFSRAYASTAAITNIVGDVTNVYTVALAPVPYTGIVTNGGSVVFTLIANPSAEVALNKVDAGKATFYLKLWK